MQELDPFLWRFIRQIYELRLKNVEHGKTNHNTITITRIGTRLRDAVRTRNLQNLTSTIKFQWL